MPSLLPFSRALLAPSRRIAIASRRSLSSTVTRRVADSADGKPNPFMGAPAPPRLPKEEQEIFEELQRQSTGAFSTPRTPPKVNQSPDSAAAAEQPATPTSSPSRAETKALDEGEELHPNLRLGAQPEFEGEKNPKTGEIGGPKNEPLRWGASGDWSFNGRVTDF
ncbi:hypothetical protein VTN00DRAFT_6939 [Thermoascus crustaceus]|uniref:uncharacterized protein n=1 Tax=Thermoascus crustaceus TaxID=5088 RepID=UPI003744AA0E